MANVVLNDITSGYSLSKINENFDTIEAALNGDRLQLTDGGNVMSQDLDMNSHNIMNVGTLSTQSITLNGQQIALPELVVTDAITQETLASSTGAGMVGFEQVATGAVLRTAQDKLSDLIYVEDFGAVGDGVTDDTTSIQNAINYVALLGGGEVNFKSKNYGISNTLTVNSGNIKLVGRGSDMPHDGGLNQAPATMFTWLSAAASPMILFESPQNSSNAKQYRGGAKGLFLNCNSIATFGFVIHSWDGARFSDLMVGNATVAAYKLTCYSSGSLAEACDSQYNVFANCEWRMINGAAVQNADGFLITSDAPGTANANSSFNVFIDCSGQNYNGSSWHLIDADNNVFINCRGYVPVGGTGVGALIEGAFSNSWYGWSGGVVCKGTASGAFQNSTMNCFFAVDDANGTAYPTLDAGCDVQWHSTKHGWVTLRSAKAVICDTQAHLDTELANIGNDTLRIRMGSQSGVTLTDGVGAYTFSEDGSHNFRLTSTGGTNIFDLTQGTGIGLKVKTVGFNGVTPMAKPTVAGSRGGNAALNSLLAALDAYGLITNASTT